MFEEDEYRERQKNEVEAIRSIYSATGEFEDLRLNDAWMPPRPPEVTLRLKSCADDGQLRGALRLVVSMPARYPDSPPGIQLREPQQLSDADLARLRVELERVARQRCGNEMVLDLVTHCQELLDSPTRSRLASPPTEEPRERQETDEGLCHLEKQHNDRQLLRGRRAACQPDSESQADSLTVDLSENTSRANPSSGSERAAPPSDAPEEPFVPSKHLSNNFRILKHIGSGGFGSVRMVQSKVDGKLYAVKMIPLKKDRPEEYEKVVTEAQCLAKLEHKNIIRYYTSWIGSEVIEKNGDDDYDDEEAGTLTEVDEEDTSSDGGMSESTRICLCIQMEYCEKSTLLSALPSLHQDQLRLWRLFREIVEGLSHVHGHRLIHRDLKPANIFLDRNDHVKIADFGLATSKMTRSRLEETASRMPAEMSGPPHNAFVEDGITCPKNPMGTWCYCAPELGQNPVRPPGAAEKRRLYNEKVDMYSLGIIWFEMCCGTFNSGSERIHHMQQLRKPEVQMDEGVSQRLTEQQAKMLRWLLQHEPEKRPLCEDLLKSELLPSPPLEEARRRQMVEACFSQPSSEDAREYYELPDDCSVTFQSATLAAVTRQRLEKLFRQRGAVSLSNPLLAPSGAVSADSAIRLMTSTGALVELPVSQRLSLARLLAGKGVTTLHYFSIGSVYEEHLPRGQPPLVRQEALFGWHAAPSGALLADAELLSLLGEVLAAFPALASRDHQLVLGHTRLLEAALETAGVPVDRREAVVELLGRLELDTPQLQVGQLVDIS